MVGTVEFVGRLAVIKEMYSVQQHFLQCTAALFCESHLKKVDVDSTVFKIQQT
jgi:hypothetical protein